MTWRDVTHKAATHIEERPDGFVLRLDEAAPDFDDIRKLVESERDCCRWMNLELDERSPATLTLTSESCTGKAVIKEMLAL
jgi:hypothetical protein